MTAAINVQCWPTPLMFVSGGAPVLVQVDEAGRVQADEAGNILQPDPTVIPVQADENKDQLLDEAGAGQLFEP